MWKDYKLRAWLYGIMIALLTVLSGFGIVDAVHTANFTALVGAILLVAPAGAFGVGIANARPSERDDLPEQNGKYGDYTDTE